jgi:hypothetical protein
VDTTQPKQPSYLAIPPHNLHPGNYLTFRYKPRFNSKKQASKQTNKQKTLRNWVKVLGALHFNLLPIDSKPQKKLNQV